MERELRRVLAAFHVRQGEAEHEALKQKEKIIARILALSRRPLDNWKATRAILLELQQTYTDVGPVAAASEADLLQAYRAACQAVVSKLGTLRGNSTEKRADVIRLIHELTDKAGKGISWRDARDKVVLLQKQYMGAGPVAHAEGEACGRSTEPPVTAFSNSTARGPATTSRSRNSCAPRRKHCWTNVTRSRPRKKPRSSSSGGSSQDPFRRKKTRRCGHASARPSTRSSSGPAPTGRTSTAPDPNCESPKYQVLWGFTIGQDVVRYRPYSWRASRNSVLV